MAIKVQGTTVIDDSRQLSVTGISTLGTLQISSGIVTATSGVVTYYGDGSNLTGLKLLLSCLILELQVVYPQWQQEWDQLY